MIAGNLAANSGLISGTQRKHNETAITQSAISGNITVKAGSTEGNYTTDVSNANKHLENNFNADKLNNQLQASQIGMQLVGEVVGQISDALDQKKVLTFGEGGFGRLGLESAASALIAAVMEGNIKTSVTSTVASGLTTAQIRILAYEIGKQLSNNLQMQVLIANAISNAVATGTGATTDLALGGSGINGAGIASTLQQYNQSHNPNDKKMDATTQQFFNSLYVGLDAASYFPVIGEAATAGLAIGYASKGDFKNAGINLLALGLGVFVGGEGKAAVKAAEEIYEKLIVGKEHTIIVETKSTTGETGGFVEHVPAKNAGNVASGVSASGSSTSLEIKNSINNSERLLNADNVIIDSNKITSYALNPEHSVGKNKAKVLKLR